MMSGADSPLEQLEQERDRKLQEATKETKAKIAEFEKQENHLLAMKEQEIYAQFANKRRAVLETKEKEKKVKGYPTKEEKFCRVPGCKIPSEHTTGGHFCRDCKKHGHNEKQCKNEDEKKKLVPHLNDFLPFDRQCVWPGCPAFQRHTTRAHYCFECKTRVPCKHLSLSDIGRLETARTAKLQETRIMKQKKTKNTPWFESLNAQTASNQVSHGKHHVSSAWPRNKNVRYVLRM